MLKKLLVSSALLLTIGFTSLLALPNILEPSNPRIYTIQGEFNGDLEVKVLEDLDKSANKAILFDINSLGGHVESEAYITQAMRKEGTVDTLVTYMAASAAAQTFLNGKHRYIEPGSVILFHGAAGSGITAPQAARMLEEAKALNETDRVHYLEMMLSILNGMNEACLHDWEPIIAQSNGKLTKEFIKEHFYHNFEHDIFVTGQELIDLGIAIDAKHIDYSKYN